MATSNSKYVGDVLDALQAQGVEFALLHGSDRVGSSTVQSDLDIVVGPDPREVMRRITPRLVGLDLFPVIDWKYDVGATRTVFLATPDASDGLQLDLLCDLAGRGRYGLRSDRILNRAAVVGGVRAADPVDELVYLIRKRDMKNDTARLAELLATARGIPADELMGRVDAVFSPVAARAVRRVITGQRPSPVPRLVNTAANRYRLLRRVLEPTGFWVHAGSAVVADGLCDRFDRFLPHTAAIELGGTESYAEVLRLVAPVRLRPGLVVSSGRLEKRPRPDHVVHTTDPQTASRDVVAAMYARTVARFRS